MSEQCDTCEQTGTNCLAHREVRWSSRPRPDLAEPDPLYVTADELTELQTYAERVASTCKLGISVTPASFGDGSPAQPDRFDVVVRGPRTALSVCGPLAAAAAHGYLERLCEEPLLDQLVGQLLATSTPPPFGTVAQAQAYTVMHGEVAS